MRELIKKEISRNSFIIIIIVLAGILIRGIYITLTPITERQHDVDSDIGHLAYIETIYKTGKLPETNKWQFYQQPLHHIISAGWIRVLTTIGFDLSTAEEGIQILTLIYSIVIIITAYFILKELNIDDKFKILIIAVMSFHPTFIILSGSINNDILMIMFTFLDLLYLLKWYKNNNYKNTIILALFVGLTALSKISGVIIAIPIIFVFILKIFDIKKNKESLKKYILNLIIFGLIALSLGLCFSLRNFVKFKQKIFYVPTPGLEKITEKSIFKDRLNPLSNEWKDVYCHPYRDCNIPAYIIKCSLFGEFNADEFEKHTFEKTLIVLNIIIICISLISLVNILKNNKNIITFIFIIFYLSEMFMYFYSNFSYPYGCTMDFRYIVPTIFTGMLFWTIDIQDKNKKNYDFMTFIITLFCINSIIIELFDITYFKI